MSEPEVHKGLVGIYADTTAISKVMPESNSLTYRGYPVQELAEQCRFEEVVYLLWNGELPNRRELAAFEKAERAERRITPRLRQVIAAFPRRGDPMDALRTAVSFMGLEDPETADNSEAATRRKALRLLARIPTAIAARYRLSHGLRVFGPSRELGFAENFFHLCFGRVPEPEVVKAFDVSLILYAEHTFNASTFTARTVTSTEADIHAAVTAAIAALKGPLHGGANEAVMRMLQEIERPERARDWLDRRLEERALVMGFGHRVYKRGDSRVPTMSRYAEQMATVVGDTSWMEISRILAAAMLERKNIYPNLDFPTGPAYYLMGFPIPMFTPIFVASRISGWAAHILEQAKDNRIIRPLSVYSGVAERSVRPIAER